MRVPGLCTAYVGLGKLRGHAGTVGALVGAEIEAASEQMPMKGYLRVRVANSTCHLAHLWSWSSTQYEKIDFRYAPD